MQNAGGNSLRKVGGVVYVHASNEAAVDNSKFRKKTGEEMTTKVEGTTYTTGTTTAAADPQLLFLNPDDIMEPETTNVRPWSVTHDDTESEIAAIEELGRSIAKEGQLQPGVVSRLADGNGGEEFHLIAGRRRLRAIRTYNLGLADGQVPLRFAAVVSDQELNAPTLFRRASHENLQRAQLSPMDFALGIQKVKSNTKGKGASEIMGKLASFFGVSKAQITEHVKLLSLPVEVQEKVHTGELSKDDAFALVRIGKEQGDAAVHETVQEALAAARTVEQQAADAVSDAVDTVTKATGEKKSRVVKAVKKAAAAAKTKVIKTKLRAVAKPGQATSRKKSEILEFFEGMQGPVYGHPNGAAQTFVRGLLEYAAGKINDAALEKLWARAVEGSDKGTPEPKAEPKVKPATKSTPKPAAKVKAKAPARPAKPSGNKAKSKSKKK